MLNHPDSIVSLSDAGAHLTFFNDAGFGLHLLGHWARDRGAMAMEEAVRRLTSHPAAVLGLTHDNEVIRGYYAAFVRILKDVFQASVAPNRRAERSAGNRAGGVRA